MELTQKEQPMTEGNFERCGKLHTLDWLFFLGYVAFLKLRLVLKLSIVSWNGGGVDGRRSRLIWVCSHVVHTKALFCQLRRISLLSSNPFTSDHLERKSSRKLSTQSGFGGKFVEIISQILECEFFTKGRKIRNGL